MNTQRFVISILAVLLISMPGNAGGRQEAQAVAPISPQPSNFELLGHNGGQPRVVFVAGSYAYASFDNEFAVINISNPGQPYRAGFALLPNTIEDIVVINTLAYVAAGNLYVVDVTNPLTPSLVYAASGQAALTQGRDISIYENALYLAAGTEGLWVYDLTNPASPAFVYTVPGSEATFTPGRNTVTTAGNRLYYANLFYDSTGYDAKLYIFDASKPLGLSLLGSVGLQGQVYNDDIAVIGDHAYVFGSSGLFIIDISQPYTPTLDNVYKGYIGYQEGHLAVNNPYIYLSDPYGQPGGVQIVDISSPSSPVQVGLVPTLNSSGIFVYNGYIYITSRFNGAMAVYSLSNPASPTLTGTYHTIYDPQVVLIQGQRAYIFQWDTDSFEIWSLTNPHSPQRLGILPLKPITGEGVLVQDIAVQGANAYLAAESGLIVIDINNPAAPKAIGSNLLNPIEKIRASGSYAYGVAQLGFNGTAVYIFNISNPKSPSLVGTYNTHIYANNLYVNLSFQNNTLYLFSTQGDNELLIALDVANPKLPVRVNLFDFLKLYTIGIVGNAVDFQPGYICMGGQSIWGGGLVMVFQIISPTDIQAVSQVSIPAQEVLDISIEGHTIYAGSDSGIWAIDISDHLKPLVIGHIDNLEPGGIERVISRDGILAVQSSNWIHDFGPNTNLDFLQYTGMYVTGRIYQANGLPFWGPTISVGPHSGIAKEPQADYFINGLTPDTYPVSASLIGARFLPALYTLTLPPDQTQVNFTVLPLPVSVTFNPGAGTNLNYLDTQSLPSSIELPANALTSTTTLTMTPTIANPPFGFAFMGHAFDIEGSGGGSRLPNLNFSQPITATISYSSYDIRLAIAENELALYWWAGSQWIDAGQTCQPATTTTQDLDHHIISVPICRGGRFALFAASRQISLPIVLR